MWRPPQKIKHPLPDARVPSADEAAASMLFSEVSLGGKTTLRERTWVPAMVPWRATEDGFVTDDVLDWYGRFAEGEPGAIVIEATGIRDVPSGPLLRIGHDRFVEGLARLTERVRERSHGRTRLLIQLIDFLRIRKRPARDRFFAQFLEVTDAHRQNLAELSGDERLREATEAEVRAALVALDDEALDDVLDRRELESLRQGFRERVTDVAEPHIRELPAVLPGLFAAAAKRAKDAGFDGVELHYAHAYTMASFLSALNTREDGYGGPREQRVRLPLEVLAAVRAAVGDRFPVGCRYLCDDIIEGGNRVDDATFFGLSFARAGMDFLSLSTGGKFEDAMQPKVGEAAYPYTGPSGYECMPTVHSDERGPFSRQIPKQAKIRKALHDAGLETPIVVAGGINHFDQMESILQRGEGDIVAAARQSLADPDWWKKLRLGRGAEIRACKYTNYCEALDQKHKAVTCQRWDHEDLDEPNVRKSDDGKRRLVAPPWRK
jgi:2,4-dienoyl-CoA reductase-like NADH-dependent reductase (Old Yellow Enzyme family)